MKIRIIIAALLLSTGFSMAQDRFEISGKLANVGSDKRITLTYINSMGKRVNDTALVKNGQFQIAGTTVYGNKASLEMRPLKRDSSQRQMQSDQQEFYLEKGNYKVEGKDNLATAAISGTKGQADYLEYNRMVTVPLKEYQAFVPAYMKAYNARDTAEVKRLAPKITSMMAHIESNLDAFIFSHPNSNMALDVVEQYRTSIIDPATFDKYYKLFDKELLASPSGRRLTLKYEKAKQMAIGKPVDFTQNDVNGKEFNIASLRGKYVLVDFWASWCKPCRAENPYLLKAYNQLKDKKFEIVSVSLDSKKESWLAAVKYDAMPWIQVSNLEAFNSGIAVKYGITAIPQNFLINPEGVIIAKNLRGENVDEQIAKLVK